MTKQIKKTALVTGANSGLGFESAAQLAELGWERVILACRTEIKASDAREQLTARTGVDPFETLALDVSDHASVAAAVETLGARDQAVDFLLLNAGLVAGKEVRRSEHGIELTAAASLVGHHILTTGMLERGLLCTHAHIVIAGSEAARGDVPGMGLPDLPSFAAEQFGDDRARALTTIARAQAPYVYANMSHYGMVKLMVAWWSAALARRLPQGMVVAAVSPGATPATNAMRNQSFVMKIILGFMMNVVGRLFGMVHTLAQGARRYLDAEAYGTERNGQFFASTPGKMIGPVVEQRQPHVVDRASQEATWRAVVELSDGANISAAPGLEAVA